MNMQNMTPWRMFWGMLGIVLFLRLIGIVGDELWYLLGIGLVVLLGSMIIQASPVAWQSRLGGMVAIGLMFWVLTLIGPTLLDYVGPQTREALSKGQTQTQNRVAKIVRPKGANAEKARAVFCAQEEKRFTEMIQYLIESFNQERKTARVKVEATRDYQKLEALIDELRVRADECQGGAVWDNLVKDVEQLSAEANVDNLRGRLFLGSLMLVGLIALIGGMKSSRNGFGKIGGVFVIAGVACLALGLFLLNEARISGKGIAVPDFARYFEYNTFSIIFPFVWIGIGLLMSGKEKVNLYAATGWLLLGFGFWSCGSIKGFSVDTGLDHITDRAHCTVSAVDGSQMSVIIVASDYREVENDPYYLDKKMAMGCSAVVQWIPYAPEHVPQRQWWMVSPKIYPPKGCVVMPTPVMGEEPQFYWQNDRQIERHNLKPGIPFRLDSRYNGKPKSVSVSINCS